MNQYIRDSNFNKIPSEIIVIGERRFRDNFTNMGLRINSKLLISACNRRRGGK